jgi:hypothetical protein
VNPRSCGTRKKEQLKRRILILSLGWLPVVSLGTSAGGGRQGYALFRGTSESERVAPEHPRLELHGSVRILAMDLDGSDSCRLPP